jgi:predicted HTH domain antitoxin
LAVQLDENKGTEKEVSSMRLSEIQKELKELGTSYSDCFDRESLTIRLQQARSKGFNTSDTSGKNDVAPTFSETNKYGGGDNKQNVDSLSMLQELRSMRIPALRAECGKRNIRWGGMFEKEDLVQALLQARKVALHFSLYITPGTVGHR